jgi:hypothetical protein
LGNRYLYELDAHANLAKHMNIDYQHTQGNQVHEETYTDGVCRTLALLMPRIGCTSEGLFLYALS